LGDYLQAIGIVVSDTHDNAKKAAQKVKVSYEELPAVLSIEDAIKVGSFHPNTHRVLEKGEVDAFFASEKCYHIVEGSVRMGGQEHFYLEPNCSLVWTSDGGNEVHMISSTQVCL
jgi:xanthine dehydrogenase/oxidase